MTQDPGIRVLPGNGAVAQLGERELCKLEVIGSIPFSSTTWFCLVSETNLAKPVSTEALAKVDWRRLAHRPSNVSQDDRDQEDRS